MNLTLAPDIPEPPISTGSGESPERPQNTPNGGVASMSWQMVDRAIGAGAVLELSAGERLVLIALAQHADEITNEAWPSNDTLAFRSGLTPRTVQRSIKGLCDAGLIQRRRRRNTSSVTVFNRAFLDSLLNDLKAIEKRRQTTLVESRSVEYVTPETTLASPRKCRQTTSTNDTGVTLINKESIKGINHMNPVVTSTSDSRPSGSGNGTGLDQQVDEVCGLIRHREPRAAIDDKHLDQIREALALGATTEEIAMPATFDWPAEPKRPAAVLTGKLRRLLTELQDRA